MKAINPANLNTAIGYNNETDFSVIAMQRNTTPMLIMIPNAVLNAVINEYQENIVREYRNSVQLRKLQYLTTEYQRTEHTKAHNPQMFRACNKLFNNAVCAIKFDYEHTNGADAQKQAVVMLAKLFGAANVADTSVKERYDALADTGEKLYTIEVKSFEGRLAHH